MTNPQHPTQATLIARLSTLVPDWRARLAAEFHLNRNQINWQISKGHLISGQFADAIRRIIDTQHDELDGLLDLLDNVPLVEQAPARRRLTKLDLRAIATAFRPGWDFKWGYPPGFPAHLAASGYVREETNWYTTKL